MNKFLLLSTGLIAIGTAFAPAMARAQDRQAAANDAGDIIVTARRTEERLQDVPISITVFSQEQLDKRNIVSASDLSAYTPSLSLNMKYGPEKSSFIIRGFVQETATAPSVGVYFADVPQPLRFGATVAGGSAPIGTFMDLQNLQVLKGPQGTLFGRNTTGGAVLIVPKKPTDRFEGYVEGSVGDHDMWRAQGVVNVPLSDTIRVRVGADRMTRDGYLTNHSGVGPRHLGSTDYFAARASIVIDVTPDIENYTIGTYSHSFGNGFGSRMAACNPLFPTFMARAACNQIARAQARGDGPWDVDINLPESYQRVKQWSAINTTTWKASDSLTIKNIFSYTEFRERSAFTIYGDDGIVPAGIGLPAAAVGQRLSYSQSTTGPNSDTTNSRDFTEELQFQGTLADGNLNWQAGGYIERSRPITWTDSYTSNNLACVTAASLNCFNPLYISPASFGGNVLNSRSKHAYDSSGVYAQATYKLSEQFSVTGGIRYTWDKIKMQTEYTRFRFPPGIAPFRVCNDSYRFPKVGLYPNEVAGGPVNLAGKLVTDPSQCHVEIETKSHKPTWLLEGDFKPTPDMMIFAKWSRGYRSGGINPLNLGLETWNPEKIDTYELGAKTSFRGEISGYFNLTGFYNNFTNQQIMGAATGKAGSGIAGIAAIVNAGKSRIYGVEADASATFFDSLRLDGGYTYLNTKIQQLVIPAVPVGVPLNPIIASSFKGDPLSYSPKHRLTLTAAYTLPLNEDIGKVTIGGTWVYTASQLSARSAAPQFQIFPATNQFNLNFDWKGVGGSPMDLAVFVTNVTNKPILVGVNGSYQLGFDGLSYAPPRMFGMRVRVNFGQ